MAYFQFIVDFREMNLFDLVFVCFSAYLICCKVHESRTMCLQIESAKCLMDNQVNAILMDLQLLVSFWQHPSEHVRMAARSLFHCAAPRSIPKPLHLQKNKVFDSQLPTSDQMDNIITAIQSASVSSYGQLKADNEDVGREDCDTSEISSWLESFENQEWLSWIGGTSQDAVASNIIVAAALVVWYPSIVKPKLAHLVVNQLIKLVMSMNDRYSSTAAELLAEGMESTWKVCLGTDMTHFLSDVLFQIECLSSAPSNNAVYKTAVAVTMREALVGTLLPSLAMADIVGFFGVIQSQIWATSSDSPVHVISLKTLIRVVRGSPKALAPYLDKVLNVLPLFERTNAANMHCGFQPFINILF